MFAMQRVAYLVQKVCQGVCVCIPFLSLWPVGTLRVRGRGNEQEFFFVRCISLHCLYVHRRLHYSVRLATEPLPAPTSAAGVKVYPPKIELLVKDISNLTLLETSQLNELLKVGLPVRS